MCGWLAESCSRLTANFSGGAEQLCGSGQQESHAHTQAVHRQAGRQRPRVQETAASPLILAGPRDAARVAARRTAPRGMPLLLTPKLQLRTMRLLHKLKDVPRE